MSQNFYSSSLSGDPGQLQDYDRMPVPPNTSVLIVAAGLSSRMQAFKPLLPLSGITIIETLLDALQTIGLNDIVLVTGFRATDIESVLIGRGIRFVRNERFAETQMFDSVKAGLAALGGRCDRFFFVPADVPLFQPCTLRIMLYNMLQQQADVVIPRYGNRRGHPVLIASRMIDAICQYTGDDGLKGALASIPNLRLELPVPDKGILLDADTPDDYQTLLAYRQSMIYPNDESCRSIMHRFSVDERVQIHCAAVARVAMGFASELVRAGHPVNVPLLRAAAMLHDIARSEHDHAACGAQWLRELGLQETAAVVAAHMDVPEEAIESLDERAILYLADKMVAEDQLVSLDQRFDTTLSRFCDDPEVLTAVKNRLDKAKRVELRIKKSLL